MADPEQLAQQAAAAHLEAERLTAAAQQARARRRDAVRGLVDAGWTYQQIGERLGVTRQRAEQIENRPARKKPKPPPEPPLRW